jgi:hypothetical protein
MHRPVWEAIQAVHEDPLRGRQRRTGRNRRQRQGRSGCTRREGLSRPDEALAALLARQPAKVQLVPHGMQAGLVHAEERVQGAIGDPLIALEQRDHGQEHGVELARGLDLLMGAWLRGRGCSRPDQDAAGLIDREALALDELVFECCQVGVIELKLQLEGTIRQATPLSQEGDRLIHHRDKVHRVSSLAWFTASVLMGACIIA